MHPGSGGRPVWTSRSSTIAPEKRDDAGSDGEDRSEAEIRDRHVTQLDLSRWSNTELHELLALHARVDSRLKSEEEQRPPAEST